MARTATSKAARKPAKKSAGKAKSRAVARVSSAGSSGDGSDTDGMGEAFIKLLQSSLVADLVAVAATAALAALAEHGFTSRGAGDDRRAGQRAGKAVKEAGKAAAAAVGRRLSNEIEEIRKASKGGAGA